MHALLFALTLLSAVGSGLMAGLFFTFSAFAMSAFARLPAVQGIAAMQSINVVIINPLFFAAFFGTAAVCVVLVVLALVGWQEPGAAWLMAGAVLYLAGYLTDWTAWNHVRTVACIAAAAALTVALYLEGRVPGQA